MRIVVSSRRRIEFVRMRGTRRRVAYLAAFLSFFVYPCTGFAQSTGESGCPDSLGQGSSSCPDQTRDGDVNKADPRSAGAQGLKRSPSEQIRPLIHDESTTADETLRSEDKESRPRNQRQDLRGEAQPTLPEPLTEFQKLAASSTGQVLPVFGADLFRNVPSTFAPLDMTPVPPEYLIGPGDELQVRVWGQINIQARVQVDRAGELYLPIAQVGPIQVAGVSFSDLDPRLRQAIGRVYRNFDVTVDVGRIRAIQVYVAGQARRPGVYTMSSLSTLVDALFASGGPSLQGSLRRIELRRGASVVGVFDLYDLLTRGDKSRDLRVASGDVIFIPPVGAQAAVTGSVHSRAIYELRPGERVSELIADAGGVSTVASNARVSIERIEGHNSRHAMEMPNEPDALSVPAVDGDVVQVFSIVPKYDRTVTLQGNIANPGRFAWRMGMHVRDLIPDRESLITRNYWLRRAQMGLTTPEFEALPGVDGQIQPAGNRPMTSTEQIAEAREPRFNRVGTNDTQQQGGTHNSLGAQQDNPSMRKFAGAPQTRITLNVPEIDWNYAVITRLDPDTLKTVLIPFDLGRLLLNDASQDIELKPGDAVSILSEADVRLPIAEQTKIVKLDGELAHPGLYSVKPSESLRQLVERAGGLTPNAYLYGTEFTREATRRIQQTRIDEYVQSLELRMQHGNLSSAAMPVNSSQELASGAAAQSSERELLARLKQIRATGRIVLDIVPESRDSATLPEISLEDGDRLVVPSVPADINVIGAVNDQNSFLHIQHLEVGAYLRKAGGLTRDADYKRMFVIRADGEVVGSDRSKRFWGGDLEKLTLYPGDTIVVPEKTFKASVLRGILDWSQMFSQFALGAAAISVIR